MAHCGPISPSGRKWLSRAASVTSFVSAPAVIGVLGLVTLQPPSGPRLLGPTHAGETAAQAPTAMPYRGGGRGSAGHAPDPGVHAAHGVADDSTNVPDPEALAQKPMLGGDHVVVVVLGELGPQPVRGFR